ncbi:class I SAM-dependent methyltransferase [Streptomyces sp. NBC_00083]|uniref:class I SAM-dependent methyltransferase n=1 Tax=Streptomyces sp. NBC_00083 TaxID=2975647 RepID=UPI0022555987|nr:class I SAM-dependent methyltransferase [Streptomyces sp. NBC_00083]MCX5386554.1 class I SAM-dependent methyltransferase [Streptomyces sp. NBC_00083]
MSVTQRYKDAWDGFWRAAPDEQGAVFWDAEPALTAARHLAHFAARIDDPDLPMVDLGCGNGTQTRYLGSRFTNVTGVDLSPAAVEHARSQTPYGEAEFEQLDAADDKAVLALHDRLGDANVYVRGVLHQCEPADRRPVADAVATLLGDTGRAFVVELAEGAKPVLMGLAQSPDGPPPKLRPVFAHGIAPGEVSDRALDELLADAGLTVLTEGQLPLLTTEYTPEGRRIELPSRWMVVGRAS